MDIPYVGFGNEQLKGRRTLQNGEITTCPWCEDKHPVRYGKNQLGEETNLVIVVSCGDKLRLVGVNGMSVIGVTPCYHEEDRWKRRCLR